MLDLGRHIFRIFRAFSAWWLGELAALVPAGVRHAFAGSSRKMVLEYTGQEIIVGLESGGGYRELGRVNSAPGEPPPRPPDIAEFTRKAGSGRSNVAIALPAAKVLRRLLRLPLPAEDNLREVLGFEMDRHTPFTPRDVYYDFRVTGRDADEGWIEIELAVVPRPEVDRVIEVTRTLGFEPLSVEIAGDGARPDVSFNLLPGDPDHDNGDRGNRLSAALGALALVLLGVAVYIPIDRERVAAERLMDRVAAARSVAEEADRLRAEIERAVELGGFLVDEKRQTPAIIDVLAELTRILPDDTWLLHLRLRGDDMVATGYSARAADLLGLVERSPRFENAKFRSIVAQDTNIGLERFQLSANISREETP